MSPVAWLGVLVLAGVTAMAPAAEPSEAKEAPAKSSTKEVDAVEAELARGLEKLRIEGAADPYRAEVRYVRADLLSLDGSYGGLITNVVDRQAVGTTEVRVGTFQRDNSNFYGTDSGVQRIEVPLEPAPTFLRRKVWLGLDRAFRGASRAFSQKEVALDRLEADEQPADFSASAAAVRHFDEPLEGTFDRDGLAATVTSLSGRFADWPTIDNGDVHLQVLRSVETVVATDGVAVQFAHARAVLAVVADTKAADGMHLDHGLAIHLQLSPKADDELLARGEALVDQVLRELDELAKAPLIEEEYDGPILFRGPAAAQLLGSTAATEASGKPPPLSEGGRMMDFEPAWQDRIGKTVMPPFIDLVDDPGATGGFGTYTVDAEGVKPERVEIVSGGVLSGLLMTRTPNLSVTRSNGRARISPALEIGPAISNLALTSRKRGLSASALERDLLQRAREDGYEFAYIIEGLRDGSVLGPVPRESAAAYAGTGKLNLPLPIRVYRLEAGGKKTLVRGAVLAPASMRVLRRIRAVGQQSHTVPMRVPVGSFGGFTADVGIDGVLSQTVDVQVSSPDLLVDGLELLVERGEHERRPVLEHPLRRQTPPPRHQ